MFNTVNNRSHLVDDARLLSVVDKLEMYLDHPAALQEIINFRNEVDGI